MNFAGSPVFLLGVNSMLGWSISQALSGHELGARVERFCNARTRAPKGAHWRRLNLQDRDAVRAVFARERPGLILHCAGICCVETCEESPDFAHEVNVGGMQNLVDLAPPDCRLVYLSSDHVFGGDSGPYTESSPPSPISVYGRTRVLAEELVRGRASSLIIRTSLWIGPSCSGRIGHLDWLRYRHARGLPMTIVADEHRSAVWADQAARRVLDLAASDIKGLRHVVATRVISRPELAAYLNQQFAIGSRFEVTTRRERPVPHLGHVDLRTEHTDALAAPLPAVVPFAAPFALRETSPDEPRPLCKTRS